MTSQNKLYERRKLCSSVTDESDLAKHADFRNLRQMTRSPIRSISEASDFVAKLQRTIRRQFHPGHTNAKSRPLHITRLPTAPKVYKYLNDRVLDNEQLFWGKIDRRRRRRGEPSPLRTGEQAPVQDAADYCARTERAGRGLERVHETHRPLQSRKGRNSGLCLPRMISNETSNTFRSETHCPSPFKQVVYNIL